MQFVAPRMYARTAEHINAELQALKKPLPYQKELQLKVFLQRPAMDPGLFGVIQDGHAASREEKRQRSQNPVPFKLTNDVRSASERVETR